MLNMLGPIPTPVYHPLVGSFLDEHLPYGVDSPHNIGPMVLFPTQLANGVLHPPRVVNKTAWHGNPLNIFRSYARIQTPSPQGS